MSSKELEEVLKKTLGRMNELRTEAKLIESYSSVLAEKAMKAMDNDDDKELYKILEQRLKSDERSEEILKELDNLEIAAMSAIETYLSEGEA